MQRLDDKSTWMSSCARAALIFRPLHIYTHKDIKAHMCVPLLMEQDPSVSNQALKVTNGVSCEHPGHPGEEDRRTEERFVCVGGLDGQTELTKTLSKNF